jgi:hypothetical protein
MDMELNGLPKGSRIAPTVLGHRGSRLVVHVPVESKVDERTGLSFCAVKSVFLFLHTDKLNNKKQKPLISQRLELIFHSLYKVFMAICCKFIDKAFQNLMNFI